MTQYILGAISITQEQETLLGKQSQRNTHTHEKKNIEYSRYIAVLGYYE